MFKYLVSAFFCLLLSASQAFAIDTSLADDAWGGYYCTYTLQLVGNEVYFCDHSSCRLVCDLTDEDPQCIENIHAEAGLCQPDETDPETYGILIALAISSLGESVGDAFEEIGNAMGDVDK